MTKQDLLEKVEVLKVMVNGFDAEKATALIEKELAGLEITEEKANEIFEQITGYIK
ncbi:MAG: hypothetical protein PWQ06_124 [Anaerophaga sp.]|jgi:flagellar motor component MotA|nr:hypothetical protein [Anaerophaga sp.]